MPMIPLVDVKAQYAPLIPELKERFGEVLESGRFILGPNVAAFEEEAAAYLGVPATIGVANGTDAIVLVLDAMGIEPGDEVICPAFTFYATAEAIAQAGATPVFADIDPATLNLDPEDVAAADHARGRRRSCRCTCSAGPAPLAELAALGVPIVEDAAQAFGAPGIATTGVASTFSFFPTKNLFALGDGGLVAVDRHRARRARPDAPLPRLARQEGLRPDRLQLAARRAAGGGAAPLPAAARRVERARREAAARYARARPRRALRAARRTSPGTSTTCTSCRSPERDRIAEALTGARDRAAPRTTCTPLHLQPALRFLGWEPGSLPGDRAGRAREPRAADVGRDRRGDPGAGRERRPGQRRRGSGPLKHLPINRHRLWQLAVDACLCAARVVPRVPAALRPGRPALLPDALQRDDLDRDPDPGRGLRPLRLLQPLVALRLDPRHVGRRARRHRRLPRLVDSSSTSPIPSRRCACRARSR